MKRKCGNWSGGIGTKIVQKIANTFGMKIASQGNGSDRDKKN